MTREENTRKRLWIVSGFYNPEETSTEHHVMQSAEGLVADFDIKTIRGRPRRGSGSRHETRNGVEIFTAGRTTLDRNVSLFHLDTLMLAVSVFLIAIRGFRAGERVVVAKGTTAIPFVIAVAALMRGSIYSLVILDNCPAGRALNNRWRDQVTAFFDRWLYKHTARIFVVDRDMFDLIARRTEGLDIPITIFPGPADLETILPGPLKENALIVNPFSAILR